MSTIAIVIEVQTKYEKQFYGNTLRILLQQHERITKDPETYSIAVFINGEVVEEIPILSHIDAACGAEWYDTIRKYESALSRLDYDTLAIANILLIQKSTKLGER